MKSFYIITNRIKDKDLSVTGQIADYIRGHGKQCFLREDFLNGQERDSRCTDLSMIPPEADCIIVLGGDGTLLQAARDVVDRQIPLFGINLGTLGYLAEIDRQSIYPALDHLMEGNYEIEQRMMLYGSVYRGEEKLDRDIALNDIVISRENGLRVIELNTYVNHARLNTYHADGIIIATPTGSTGYSLSAGGPIISPAAALFLMTPLAPHTLGSRSVVLPPENEITIEIGPGRDEKIEEAVAYFDGDTRVPMLTGDRIEISRSRKDTLIVKIHNSSFLETLSRKMSNV
ncbi:NAD(+)/NADH kinase [Lachnospiraceae bacterium OF09-33XD]|nr:NAD(+)/NADH kinase [Lachnospiraceae bacterium OF09-33XD]